MTNNVDSDGNDNLRVYPTRTLMADSFDNTKSVRGRLCVYICQHCDAVHLAIECQEPNLQIVTSLENEDVEKLIKMLQAPGVYKETQ